MTNDRIKTYSKYRKITFNDKVRVIMINFFGRSLLHPEGRVTYKVFVFAILFSLDMGEDKEAMRKYYDSLSKIKRL